MQANIEGPMKGWFNLSLSESLVRFFSSYTALLCVHVLWSMEKYSKRSLDMKCKYLKMGIYR